jgi:NAD(P)-dependent dehydrogenase (short-subunit alcohol dehydrogenase family)
MSKVWLVTGSASGWGREIAEAVLASGDRVRQCRALRFSMTPKNG